MLNAKRIHHIAIICTNYEVSKYFYTEILGFHILSENFRKERQSYKLDLAINGVYCIELFSFPTPPHRLTRPEAAGLRHLAIEVEDMESSLQHLASHGILFEAIRTDEFTGKRYAFFEDPDKLPLELYEM